MPTDYEKLYQSERHVLGAPTQEFVDFFDNYPVQHASVLDVGCGQGRDALHIGRLGHRVTGVDLSSTGIAQLLEDAKAENLQIAGVVADLCEYEPSGEYDVIVVDRTLHMLLDETSRLTVLSRLCAATKDGGYVLIADETSNLPGMRDTFEKDPATWKTIKDERGFLFMQKA